MDEDYDAEDLVLGHLDGHGSEAEAGAEADAETDAEADPDSIIIITSDEESSSSSSDSEPEELPMLNAPNLNAVAFGNGNAAADEEARSVDLDGHNGPGFDNPNGQPLAGGAGVPANNLNGHVAGEGYDLHPMGIMIDDILQNNHHEDGGDQANLNNNDEADPNSPSPEPQQNAEDEGESLNGNDDMGPLGWASDSDAQSIHDSDGEDGNEDIPNAQESMPRRRVWRGTCTGACKLWWIYQHEKSHRRKRIIQALRAERAGLRRERRELRREVGQLRDRLQNRGRNGVRKTTVVN